MILIEEIIKEAIEREASDIHLIKDLKPVLRIARDLEELSKIKELEDVDLFEIYDYVIKGNIEKDNVFRKDKKLDTSIIFNGIRLRVNISLSDEVPVFTMRIVINELPKFEDLGIPEVAKNIAKYPQGLVLVTGKINSGKSTTLNAIVDYINNTESRKIITLECPIEYKHTSNKSIIVQKEVGPGKDVLNYIEGVKNALREDCDILVVGEIRDKETMDAAIDMAESGHVVIGTLHTKSCAETIDRIINLYDIRDQAVIKNLLSYLLKLVISQRLLKSPKTDELLLVPEVMVVDNIVSACIRKDKFNISDIEDAIQSNSGIESKSLINSLAEMYVEDKLTLDQVKSQIDEKNYETLNRTIMQMKFKKNDK